MARTFEADADGFALGEAATVAAGDALGAGLGDADFLVLAEAVSGAQSARAAIQVPLMSDDL